VTSPTKVILGTITVLISTNNVSTKFYFINVIYETQGVTKILLRNSLKYLKNVFHMPSLNI